MNRALSASDLPLVMWLCGRLDPSNTPTALPQHILVCLLQQLSASNLLEDTVRFVHHVRMCWGRVMGYQGVNGVRASDVLFYKTVESIFPTRFLVWRCFLNLIMV